MSNLKETLYKKIEAHRPRTVRLLKGYGDTKRCWEFDKADFCRRARRRHIDDLKTGLTGRIESDESKPIGDCYIVGLPRNVKKSDLPGGSR